MSEKDWNSYLNSIQLSYLPVTLSCIGVMLLLSAFRDFVFTDFQPPLWLNALNAVGIGMLLLVGLFTIFKKESVKNANLFLFISILVLCTKPTSIVLVDNSPGSLVLATVIFSAGLIFLSYRFLLLMQALTLLIWLFVTFENFGSLQYFATFVVAVVSGSLGTWLQNIRLNQLQNNFELENRVGELETIIPMCASCKKTRNSDGDWLTVEQFIEGQGDSMVSHGVCPDCKDSLYGSGLQKSA